MKTISFPIIAIIIAVIFNSCSGETPVATETDEAICVRAENLTETNASVPVQCSGILSSKKMVKLSFKTGGIIAAINVEEGSKVKKGQLIATLDMTEISSQVNQAKLAFDKAKRDLDRVKNLYNDTVATLEQLQDATSAYEAAKENKNIAEFNLRFSSITAPANGRIIAKLAEEYELIGSGMPVVVFSGEGKDEWIVKAGIADKDAISIKKGDKAEISIDAFPDRIFPAIVTQLAESADPLSGTFDVEITVDPQNERFLNGLVAKVKIESMNTQLVTLVPPEAVTEANGRKGFVYVFEKSDTTARKVPVTIAYLQSKSIAIIEPVNKMGLVITKGSSYLEDGTKVNVVR
jgi:multidrug efflux system membrane fusion protein